MLELERVDEQFVHDQFRGLVLSPSHPCLGAHSAVRRGHYGFGLYDVLGSRASAGALREDLIAFDRRRAPWNTDYTTYVASFREPAPASEQEFEALLWRQLELLQRAGGEEPWDASVSADPDDPDFSFSVGGRAFFVVGLHAASSRYARRFAWPTLCFNPHDQFERIRGHGHFTRMRDQVRVRDTALQGMTNPMVRDHGTASEAAQYSGRHADASWRCPLDVRREP